MRRRATSELLADLGLEGACKKQPALIGGINTRDGRVTYAAVAEAHGLKYEAAVLELRRLRVRQLTLVESCTFGKAEKFAALRFRLSPKYGQPIQHYEKITLHSGQRRASRSVRAKNRGRRSGDFAG